MDGTGPAGFTRDGEGNTHDVEAVEDEDLVNDSEEEQKSQEPDDGEDLDERIDE